MSEARAFRAPGRVNLIGDHTDYNEGFVLPAAIELECVVACEPAARRPRPPALDRRRAAWSSCRPTGATEPSEVEPRWGRYAAGVVRMLAERRPAAAPGSTPSSRRPSRSAPGLSSSAALEVAVALALCDAAGFELPPLELALACQAGRADRDRRTLRDHGPARLARRRAATTRS